MAVERIKLCGAGEWDSFFFQVNNPPAIILPPPLFFVFRGELGRMVGWVL